VAEELEKKLDCGIVQTIGRVIVIYRPSKKHKKIVI
jgi:RNA-binding protein YhbY